MYKIKTRDSENDVYQAQRYIEKPMIITKKYYFAKQIMHYHFKVK